MVSSAISAIPRNFWYYLNFFIYWLIAEYSYSSCLIFVAICSASKRGCWVFAYSDSKFAKTLGIIFFTYSWAYVSWTLLCIYDYYILAFKVFKISPNYFRYFWHRTTIFSPDPPRSLMISISCPISPKVSSY